MDKNMKIALLFVFFSIVFFLLGYFLRNVIDNGAIIGWSIALLCQVISFFFVYRYIYSK